MNLSNLLRYSDSHSDSEKSRVVQEALSLSSREIGEYMEDGDSVFVSPYNEYYFVLTNKEVESLGLDPSELDDEDGGKLANIDGLIYYDGDLAVFEDGPLMKQFDPARRRSYYDLETESESYDEPYQKGSFLNKKLR